MNILKSFSFLLRKQKSIQSKILTIVLFSNALGLAIGSLFFIVNDIMLVKKSLVYGFTALADVTSKNLEAPLYFGDAKAGKDTLLALMANEDILGACVYDKTGKIFTTYTSPGSDLNLESFSGLKMMPDGIHLKKSRFLTYKTVNFKGNILGRILIMADTAHMLNLVGQHILYNICLFTGICALIYLLSTRAMKIITGPLNRLYRAVESITREKNYSLRVTYSDDDEFGRMIKAFNQMISEIQIRDSQLENNMDILEEKVQERTRTLNELNRELLKEKEKAEVASQAKTDFLANMSHEIRTPMNAILGLSHLSLKAGLDRKQNNYILKIKRAAESLLQIIDDILDFSKIEAGKLVMEVRDLDLKEIVQDISTLLSIKAHDRGLNLVFNIDPKTPVHLKGDGLRLSQILMNLIGNAIKFTEKGDIFVFIYPVQVENDQVILKFEVADTGIGLTREQQGKLFQSFQQADTSTTRKFGGTGLGLAICKNLVDLMGGTIGVESEIDNGSTFYFTAKFGCCKDGTQPENQAGFPPNGAQFPDHSSGDHMLEKNQTTVHICDVPEGFDAFRGARILLVEDNEINQEVAVDMLEGEGFFTDVAGNGKDALNRLKDPKFAASLDLILMDLQMPVMDGYDASRQIRKIDALKALPIIAMTADVMNGVHEKAEQSGMSDYISKPIDPALLFSTLAKWIKPGDRPLPDGFEPRPVCSPLQAPAFKIPGINVSLGIYRVSGNVDAYKKMLKKFVLHHRDAGQKIVHEVENQNLKEASALAHMLKGVAGNIGASDLYNSLLDLEKALTSHGDKDIPSAADKANTILLRTVSLIEPVLEQPDLPDQSASPPDRKPEKEILSDMAPMLDRLSQLLETFNVDAENVLETLMEKARGSAMEEGLMPIQKKLDGYDFEGAAQELSRFRETVNTKMDP